MRRTAVLLICFLSGFSALVCEMVWSRMLVPVFGNTIYATSMVTGIFMGGLALGALAGRCTIRLDGRGLWMAYAAMEAGIGLFALLFPFLKQGVMPVYLYLVALMGPQGYLAGFIRLLCFGLLLLPPTLLMGATFPFLGAIFIGGRRRTGRDTALVYGFNTLGGTAGVLAAGFLLIRDLGSHASLALAGGVSLCLALAIALVIRKGPLPRWKQPLFFVLNKKTGKSPLPARPMSISTRLVLAGAGLAGFCALAYEMVWTRLLVLVLQNSVYAFALILAGFLAGIGFGSLLVAPVLQRKWPALPLFAVVQILSGLACLLAPLGFTLPERSGELSYLAFLLTRPFFVVLMPMLLSGALVPLAVAVVHRSQRAVGQTLGQVYAVNALGSVAGALLAGFALIPVLGCHWTGLLLFGLQVLCGTLLLAVAGKSVPFRLAAGTTGVLLVALGTFLLPSDLVRQRYVSASASEKPLFFEEGRVATTSVTRNRAGNLTLYLNGIPEVINDRPALRTFRLMALLPYLLHPDPDEALMITFGAGISAGLAVHLYPHVTCVELNEICRRIADLFKKDNRNVMGAGNLTLQIDDGRNFLLHARTRYAAIISDATHPHSYDSWILFTRDFYRLCARRLDDCGVFCQWLPLHGLAPQQFRTILNTVQSVFPEFSVWVVDGAYCLMLAGEKPLHLDPQRLATVLNRSELRPFLSPVGLDNPYAILNCFVADRTGLKPLLEEKVLINTDDRPHNQFFPLAVTGFGRLRWHIENLRQLVQCRQKKISLIDSPGEKHGPPS